MAGLRPLDRHTFDVRGYLLFEQVLDRRTISKLRSAIDEQRLPPADETIERQRFGSAGSLFTWHRTFCDLIDHPLVLAVLSELIGPFVRLDHAYGITMRPGTAGLGLHGPAEPVLYKYSPGSTAWGDTPAAPPEVVATMSDRQQRFFQPPSVGGRVPAIP